MELRWTLFNGITIFVMLATLWMAYARLRFRPESSWFLLYYVVIVGFWKGFPYSLNTAWVAVGVAIALVLRFQFTGGVRLKVVRAAEYGFFGYVVWRGVGLLLGW